jgi:hypothetical protein
LFVYGGIFDSEPDFYLHVEHVVFVFCLLSFCLVCMETGSLYPQQKRSSPGGARDFFCIGLGKITMRIYLVYAGGVGSAGFLGCMSFFDVPTQIWRLQRLQSATATKTMVEKANGKNP